MKPLLLAISVLLLNISLYSQSQSIPKTYSYFSEKEEWRLTIFDFKTFELHIKKSNDSYFITVDGYCILTDSTIQFNFYSSVTLDFIKKDESLGPNIKEFIKGSPFKRYNDYIIPKTSVSPNVSNNIKKSYFQQVELYMGGTSITFEKKDRYTLTNSFCTGKFIEKGRYAQLGNIIILKPNKNSINASSSLMDNSTLFVNKDYLISRKIQPSRDPARFEKEEVFLYFIRI